MNGSLQTVGAGMWQAKGSGVVLTDDYVSCGCGQLQEAKVKAVALLVAQAVFIQHLRRNFGFCFAHLACQVKAACDAHKVGQLRITPQLVLVPAVGQKLVADEQAGDDRKYILLPFGRRGQLLQIMQKCIPLSSCSNPLPGS